MRRTAATGARCRTGATTPTSPEAGTRGGARAAAATRTRGRVHVPPGGLGSRGDSAAARLAIGLGSAAKSRLERALLQRCIPPQRPHPRRGAPAHTHHTAHAMTDVFRLFKLAFQTAAFKFNPLSFLLIPISTFIYQRLPPVGPCSVPLLLARLPSPVFLPLPHTH